MSLAFRKSTVLMLLAALALVVAPAANSIAGTVQVKLTGVNGATQGGVDVDPYFGTINNGPAVPLICDDFSHGTSIGETWTANVSTLSDLSSVRFQQGTPAATLQAYSEAAWLAQALQAHPSQYGNITFALWALFTPSAESSSGFTSGAETWLTNAESQTFTTGEFANLEILTPTPGGSGSPQEMLTFTPEPASVLLFVTGLAALALVGIRRRRAQGMA